jgi:hypothetical protein
MQATNSERVLRPEGGGGGAPSDDRATPSVDTISVGDTQTECESGTVVELHVLGQRRIYRQFEFIPHRKTLRLDYKDPSVSQNHARARNGYFSSAKCSCSCKEHSVLVPAVTCDVDAKRNCCSRQGGQSVRGAFRRSE